MDDTSSSSEAKKARRTKRVISDNVASYYTNSINIRLSVYDVSLLFGEVEEATEDSFVVRQIARVTMSPQHAKALATLLSNRLEAYERQFGPLPDVSSVLDRKDTDPSSAA